MEEKGFQDYCALFRRRRTQFAAIAAGIFTLGLLTAFLLPATYRSTATILIEEQEIPPDLVRSTITTYAAQALQIINQRVMTRANLENIIAKFNLYPDARERLTTEEVIDRMRDDITLDTISADVIDPRTGRPSSATIAFTLSYDGRNPDLVQRVANEITSLYLEENLKNRTQKTAETSDFLKEEARQMGEYVAVLENKLSAFKESHLYTLPEQKQLNLELLDRTERELLDVDNEIRAIEDRKFYLDGQLALIRPEIPILAASGERILSPEDRLKALQTEYLGLASRYSDKHPDMVKAHHEIESLTLETGEADGSLERAKQLQRLLADQVALREKYADSHPDMVVLNKRIAALEASLDHARTHRSLGRITRTQPENPAYITLRAQRDSNVQDLQALLKKRREIRGRLKEFEDRLVQSPAVERQYLELVRDYENATTRYRELKAKEMEAQVAEQLEKKSKGERFSIIEPPLLPEKPVRPNRLVIAALGWVLAIGGAAAYILLRDSLDPSIRGTRTVALLAGAPPLAVIPHLETDEDLAGLQRKRSLAVLTTLALVLLSAGLVHFFWIPLDVLWFKALRKFDTFLY
jgi:succinoglycan biosynthesis transport protein ExoP